jgi:peptidoglycan/LPS O-acetylase OafA/YrhL
MPKRLHSLDTLRGVAALGVVLWHWQHFFSVTHGTPMPGWLPEWEPFFPVLKAGYLYGWMAVDLFFALSGFIFFWLYAEAVAEGRITPRRFAMLRFSRLYPLHWLTLFVVVVLQWSYHKATAGHFVYHANDLTHFLASLAFVQNWLHDIQSFNGPSWSVSIEVLVYILFFALCRAQLMHWAVCLAMIAGGFAIYHFHFLGDVGRGVMGFFAGAIAFKITQRIKARSDAARIARIAAGTAMLAWAVAIGQLYWPGLAAILGTVSVLPRQEIPILLFALLVGVPTLIALALHEQVLGGRYERFSFLGDISYSTYLLHFPMQLLLANIAVRQGWLPQDFMSPFVLIAFYAVLVGLGFLTYRFFERPMQAAIRGTSRSRFAPQPDRII